MPVKTSPQMRLKTHSVFSSFLLWLVLFSEKEEALPEAGKGAYVTLAILTSINLLNYIDRYLHLPVNYSMLMIRYIPSACKELIKKDFNNSFNTSGPITDAQTGISFRPFIYYYLSWFFRIFLSCIPRILHDIRSNFWYTFR
jgi:hypothetical protein